MLSCILLLLAIGCEKEGDHSDMRIEPEPITHKPDTVYYDGLITSSVYAECLAYPRSFDSAYPGIAMVEYPDSGSIRFHFSFADYKIEYGTCDYEQFQAVRMAKFDRRPDNAYAAGTTKVLPGASRYNLRGDSLLIAEDAKESKWYNRHTMFAGKRR
jgi:hypothetical protein